MKAVLVTAFGSTEFMKYDEVARPVIEHDEVLIKVVKTSVNFADMNELTNGQGVDIILDSIAGTVTEDSLKCLAPYGRLVHFGNSSGETGEIKTTDLHSSWRSVQGFSLGTTRKLRPHLLQETAEYVMPYLVNKELKIKVGHEYPLSKAAEAHDLMENRLNKGKITLHVESGS